MRRLFWLAMGITVGVMVMRRLQETAQRYKPNAVAQRAGRHAADAGHNAKSFFADVRDAMREREAELREGTGLDAAPDSIDPDAAAGGIDPDAVPEAQRRAGNNRNQHDQQSAG